MSFEEGETGGSGDAGLAMVKIYSLRANLRVILCRAATGDPPIVCLRLPCSLERLTIFCHGTR